MKVEFWPFEASAISPDKQGKEVVKFDTIVATIDRVFDTRKLGYSFQEDATKLDTGYTRVWEMQEEYDNGKWLPYSGQRYDAGQTVEVKLLLREGRWGKVNKIALAHGDPFTKTGTDAPPVARAATAAPVKSANDRDLHIRRAQFLNLIVKMLDTERVSLFVFGVDPPGVWVKWIRDEMDALLKGEPLSSEHPPWDMVAYQRLLFTGCRKAFIDAFTDTGPGRGERFEKGMSHVLKLSGDGLLTQSQADELRGTATILQCKNEDCLAKTMELLSEEFPDIVFDDIETFWRTAQNAK